MTRRARHVWIATGAVVVLLVAFAVYAASDAARPHGNALYMSSIRVVGQVVDGRTGEPVEGARVYPLYEHEQAEAQVALERLLAFEAEWPSPPDSPTPSQEWTTTDAEGRFAMQRFVRWCSPFGPGIEPTEPPPRYGARMIAVEAEGYRRAFVPTASAPWTPIAADDVEVEAPRGLLDVGVLRLPPAE